MNLCTPLGNEVCALQAGDRVTLSGTIYTARDKAHARMLNEGIPFDAAGSVIFHSGPLIREGQVLAAGPTTSSRMEQYTGFLMDRGVRAFIGKGGMDRAAVEALRGRGVYLSFTGGCAALAASHMTVQGVLWDDLGMAEAIWILHCNCLPLIVGIDASGGDLFGRVRQVAEERFFSMYGGRNASRDVPAAPR